MLFANSAAVIINIMLFKGVVCLQNKIFIGSFGD